MAHQLRAAVQLPRLGEVGLYTQELGVGVLEERLVLLLPAVSLYEHVVECSCVSRLLDGGFPSDGVALAGGALIQIGVAHLGYELVLHGGAYVGVGGHDAVEL